MEEDSESKCDLSWLFGRPILVVTRRLIADICLSLNRQSCRSEIKSSAAYLLDLQHIVYVQEADDLYDCFRSEVYEKSHAELRESEVSGGWC